MGNRIGVPVLLGILAALALAVAGCGGGGGGGDGSSGTVRGGIGFFPLIQGKLLTYRGGPNNPGDTIQRLVTQRTVKNGQLCYVMRETVNGTPTRELFFTVVNPASIYLAGERSLIGAGVDVYYNPSPPGPGVFVVMTPPQGSYPAVTHPVVNATDGTTYAVTTTTVGGLTVTTPAGRFTDVLKVRQVWTSPGGTEIRLMWLVSDPILDVGIIQAGHEDPLSGAEIIDSRLSAAAPS
jgi:hypothetical protein